MAASARDATRVLAESGCTRAFVVGSNHNLKVLDGLTAAGIKSVAMRHEVGAVHAADAHARVSGIRTAVVTSTGPGAGNAIGAFSAAAKDGSPVVHVTTTHFPAGPRGQGVHSIMDQGGWLRAFDAPVLDAAVLDVEAIAQQLAATTGAVTLVIPDDEARCHALPAGPAAEPSLPMAVDAVKRGLDEWLKSERPLLFVGGGARSLSPAVLGALATRRGAAVVTTVQGKDLFDPTHPNFVGCTLQSDLTKEAIAGATSCLALGSRVTELSSASWSALPSHVVRIGFSNDDPLVPGATYAHLPVDVAAAVAYLDAALPNSFDGPESRFGAESGARYRAARAGKGRVGAEYEYLEAIGGALRPDDALVCDMTKLAFWALLALDMPEGARWLWPGMLNMGFGLPGAIGAAYARPDAHIVMLCGDGGLLTIAAELDLLASTPGRISIVLIDDDGYGLLRPFASDAVRAQLCTFGGPDWQKLTEAFGVRYLPIESGAHLSEALQHGERGATVMHIDGTDLCTQNWRQA